MNVRLVAVLAVVLASLAAVGWQSGWFGTSSVSTNTAPQLVTEIPSILPPGGVRVAGAVALTPWERRPKGAMSAAQALAAARHFSSADFPASAPLAAELTLQGSPTKRNVPVWVVTYTSPKPVDVSQGFGSLYVTHRSVAVNAVTGKFVLGFFEP